MTAACPACVAAPTALDIAEVSQPILFSVPSIKCAACIGLIEGHLTGLIGVRAARVNATQRRVSVQTDLPNERIVEELKSIGYDAFPLDLANLNTGEDPIGRDLILRMGVAGFAMMNVMLLSVAVWSGATDATRDLFHLVSAVIALPAVIYSGQPFFKHALSALRVRRLNMDVPISLAIILAACMSLFESLHGGAHAYFDAALSLTFFLLIGRYLEHRTKSTARSAASELAALEVQKADRWTGRTIETVDVDALVVDDVIRVNAGMRVPVDGDLASRDAFTDRSFLTGESEPVRHMKGDALCAGEINLGAPFEMTATAVGPDTRLRRIAMLVETAETARNSYTSLADKAARIYAPVVHVMAAVSFLAWVLIDGDFRNATNIAIAVLIITCPCALGLAVPAVSTAAISKLYEMGFLVKSGTALERLATTTTMSFDKTGTLTQPGFAFGVDRLNPDQASVAKALAQHSSHPLSKALAQFLETVEAAKLDAVREQQGLGVSGLWFGEDVALGRGDWLGNEVQGLALKIGNQIFALPYEEIVEPGAETLCPLLEQMQVNCEIISGDNEDKTQRLAKRLGFKNWLSNASPEGKALHIENQAASGAVCMVGDGINDTAALMHAHVSIAPGSALDATRNAADIVMIGGGLAKLPTVLHVARKSVRLSKQNFAIAVVYNLIAVPIAMAGFATPLIAALAMSASSITVLINAMRVRM